MAHYKLLCYYC